MLIKGQVIMTLLFFFLFFFFNDTATTEIYTLSLHDALPISPALPAYPFPIVIADLVGGTQATATERMLVTGDTARSQSGGIWTMTFTVQRGDGMTTRAAHGSGYRVMSTPLPLI